MLNFKTLLCHALAAVALASTALVAQAGTLPTYHVTVDASAFSINDAGFVDMTIAGVAGGAEAIATVSNLQGSFGAIDSAFTAGVVESSPGVFVLSSLVGNYLSHNVTLGGVFSFDVNFSGDFLTTSNLFSYVNKFDVALYSAASLPLALLTLEASQLSAFGPAGVVVAPGSILADVTMVPEPSELALMVAGLAMLGLVSRRRRTAR